ASYRARPLPTKSPLDPRVEVRVVTELSLPQPVKRGRRNDGILVGIQRHGLEQSGDRLFESPPRLEQCSERDAEISLPGRFLLLRKRRHRTPQHENGTVSLPQGELDLAEDPSRRRPGGEESVVPVAQDIVSVGVG